VNLEAAFAAQGVIENDSLEVLGGLVTAELGLSIDACS
jgi:hypothetical protein